MMTMGSRRRKFVGAIKEVMAYLQAPFYGVFKMQANVLTDQLFVDMQEQRVKVSLDGMIKSFKP